MLERAILTIKTLRDRLAQHDVWRIEEATSPATFWRHVNIVRNSTRSSVVRGLSPWEAQRLEPPPLLRKPPEEFGDEDDECILQDWKKFRVLEQERESLVGCSNYLAGLREIAERVHRSICLRRSYKPGDNVELKL